MSVIRAIFDGAALGADLAIGNGGVQLTTITDSLSINRTARMTVAALEYESFGEFIVHGLSGTVLTNKVSIGIVTDAALLSTYVGKDDQGVGYRLAEGEIHANGVSVATVTVGALGDSIGVLWSPDGEGSGTIAFYRTPKGGVGALLGSVVLPVAMEGQDLYLAVSIGSTADPGDIIVSANTGQSDYEYPAAGQDAGWWESPYLAGPMRFGDVPFVSDRTDEPAYARFEGGITAADITEDRALDFWIWRGGGGGARGSAVSINITDPAGIMTPAMGGSYRDQPATLVYVEDGDTLADAVSLGSYVVERVEARSTLGRQVTLRDSLALLEVDMQKRRIRPDADQEAAGRAWPLLIGPGFSLPLVLLDQTNRVYAIDSNGVEGIGRVRDRGNPFDPLSSSADYTVADNGQTLTLANEPVGIITADATVTGNVFVEPPAPTDIIASEGNPFVTGLTGWITGTEGSQPDTAPSYAGSDQVGFPQLGVGSNCYIQHDTALTTAGTRYLVRFTINSATLPDEFAPSGFLSLARSASPFDNVYSVELNFYSAGSFPQVHELVVTATSAHPIVLFYKAHQSIAGTVLVEGFEVIEMPPIIDDTFDEDETDEAIAALALGLESMAQQGIEVRGRRSADIWDATTAAAIDTATGYAGQGFWAQEGIVLREYLGAICDSYTASIFLNNAGKLAFARLIDPEAETATGEITENDILAGGEPVPTWDDMPGLTRRFGIRRNEHVFEESDLATDLDAVSWRARRKLTRQHRYVATYGGPLASGLEHAEAADPLDSRLLLRADGQAEIDRVCGIAAAPFCKMTLNIREPRRFDLGQVVTVPSSWFPEGSRNCLIVAMRDRRLAQTGTITVWTRAPWSD